MKKQLISVFAALAAGATLAAVGTPTVSSVTQDTASGTVKIAYDLSGEEAAIVTMAVVHGDKTIERLTASGDVNAKVSAGSGKTIVWRIADDMVNGVYDASAMSIRLTAWSLSTPPLYMAIRADQPADVHYYASEAALPESIGSAFWKEKNILLRKISAKGITWRAGAPNDAANRTNEKNYTTYGGQTPRYVENDHDFYIGIYEMTQGQHLNLMGSNPSKCHKTAWAATSKHYQDHLTDWQWHPVEGLEWTAAQAACARLAEGSGLAFRLPNEEEWEFAARGPNGSDGNPTHFSTTMLGYAQLKNYIVNYQCAATYYNSQWPVGGAPMPVGMKTPNGWGLHDMLGNVAECCLAKDGESKVLRGGRSIMSNEEHNFGYQVAFPWADAYHGYRVCCAIPNETEE